MNVDLRKSVISGCQEEENLQAVVVFGSVLRRSDARDVDIAMLWSPEFDASLRWKRGNAVAARVERQMPPPIRPVDIKDLRNLPLPLQYRVLREGELVLLRDRDAWVRFQSETLSKALDYLPIFYRLLRTSAEKVARG